MESPTAPTVASHLTFESEQTIQVAPNKGAERLIELGAELNPIASNGTDCCTMMLTCSSPVQPVYRSRRQFQAQPWRLLVSQYQAPRLHGFVFHSRPTPQPSSTALPAVFLRNLTTMNSTYRHLSSYPPNQPSQSQENNQRLDGPSLQTLDYDPPSPDNTLRRASEVSSRTRSSHASNISLRSPSASAASLTSSDGTALQPADPPQAAANQQQSTKPEVEEAKYDDEKSSTRILSQMWQWKFETSLLFLSVCSLLAIIVLLAVEDGKTLDSWKFYLSLNTVVSILGTISRASLASSVGSCIAQEKWNWFRKRQDHLYLFDRFDSASRGPLGSLKLLYWLKFR